MDLIKKIQFFCFALISVLIIAAYAPGLHGPFVFDDTVNITENPAVKITSISLRNLVSSASLDGQPFPGRALARISFALNYYLAGGNLSPYAFKITNLVIHLANSWLVYLLALLLFRQLEHRNGSSYTGKYHQWLPCLAAAIWAIHPLQLTSVLYVVQRMTSLSAFFVLAGLIVAILGRQRLQDARPFGLIVMAAGLVGGLILGSASKENAILLPLFMLLVEWIFFERATLRQSARKQLWIFYGLILTPYILGLLWLASDPDIILNSYANREFTLFQRLLTEPRVLLYYLQLLLFPRVSELSLFHDDIAISTGFVSPWTTLPALIGLLASTIFSIFRSNRFPILGFSILWYVLGHSMESSIVGLEIAHEHRNYIPSIGPIIGLSYGLILLFSRFQSAVIPILLSVSIVMSLFISTYVRADTWKSEESIIESMARYHPDSSRSQFMMGELYTEKKHDVFKALPHYYKAYELAPHETGYLVRIAMIVSSINSTQISREEGDEFNRRRPPATIFPPPMAVEKSGDSGKVSLSREYSAFISDQLKQRSPTENTRQIMTGLSRCLADGVEICQKTLPDIIEWYKAVLANLCLNDKHRKDYVISLFEIGLTSRNYGLAFDATRYGKSADPTDPDYTLMEANIYILQNKTDIAEKLIYSVTSSGADIKNDISNKAAALLSSINARKKNIEKENN